MLKYFDFDIMIAAHRQIDLFFKFCLQNLLFGSIWMELKWITFHPNVWYLVSFYCFLCFKYWECHKKFHIEEGWVKCLWRHGDHLSFTPLYSALATQKLFDTLITDADSVLCDFEAGGYIFLVLNSCYCFFAFSILWKWYNFLITAK